MWPPDQWDYDYDVVVVGYGYAGGMAAVAAHDHGVRVAIFEKTPHFGGLSILSSGSCVAGTEYDATLAYLVRTCMGTTDQEVLEAFALGMIQLPALLSGLAREVGFETVVDRLGGAYPFPGSEQLVSVHVTRNAGYQGFSWVRGAKAGATLFRVLAEHVGRRSINQYYNAPVRQLVTDVDGAVIGVRAVIGGQDVYVRARRGVVLSSGGFEQNQRLLSYFLPIPNACSIAPLSHTGDGLLMAQKVGASIWHTWHVHGSYGFRVQGIPYALRHSFGGFRDPERRMPWIVVDRFGRRFMNEYPPAPQDTPIRVLEYYDPDIQDYPRIPCYLVFDEEGRKLGPIAEVKLTDEQVEFEWSRDNLAEVSKGYIKSADTIDGLARDLGLDPRSLREAVRRWNAMCLSGHDHDYGRPPGTMMPIASPPFYGIEAWPVVTNTQGGVVHNSRQQVLDPYGHPVPRLYVAGELGSIFGHLYMLGGNLSECFIAGKAAGEHAADEEPWRT